MSEAHAPSNSKDSPTRQLARFVSGVTYDSIPPAVKKRVMHALIDTVGCGVYGSQLPWCRTVADFAADQGQGAEATIWGTGLRVPAANAVLANGTQVQSFELDDLHRTSVIHPGSQVVPVCVALAEYVRARGRGTVDGRRFLAAVAAGYEAGCRVGAVVGATLLIKGFHPSPVSGTIASAAAACNLLGLDEEVTAHALGIAATQSAGLMSAQYGSSAKRFHAGRSAQSGMYAVFLAARGFLGIPDVLERSYGGFCSTLAPGCDPAGIVRDLGSHWETMGVGFKIYPSCGSCHTAIDGLREIIEGRRGIDQRHRVREVRVYMTEASMKHVGWAYEPTSVTSAQMNLQYALAAYLVDGSVSIGQYKEDRIGDPRILEVIPKVKPIHEPTFDLLGPRFRHRVRVEVDFEDGTSESVLVDRPKGDAEKPLEESEILGKFRSLVSAVLGEKRTAQLEETLLNLESLDDVAVLGDLLLQS